MSYSIRQLSELAGVSTRTLRWYEQQGLLRPKRRDNGYRFYDNAEVECLQQILFYRELGFELKDIRELMGSANFDSTVALQEQLHALKQQQQKTEQLIETIQKTIRYRKEGIEMTDNAKFEAFKQQAITENEQKYGKEIRELYGDQEVDASNAKFTGLTEEQYKQVEELSVQLAAALQKAVPMGDVESAEAEAIVKMHKQWLCFFWSSYSAEQHKGVTQMYVDDQRFKDYYETIISGAAEYLRDAVQRWA